MGMFATGKERVDPQRLQNNRDRQYQQMESQKELLKTIAAHTRQKSFCAKYGFQVFKICVAIPFLFFLTKYLVA
jgi:hypothetical protein